MFLGARALQPLRFKFDVSSRSDEESARYWAAMADEFDYFEMESVREEMRGRVTSFLNLAYFNGPFLMSKMESYRVDLPDGTIGASQLRS
jgi:hypothetical protein